MDTYDRPPSPSKVSGLPRMSKLPARPASRIATVAQEAHVANSARPFSHSVNTIPRPLGLTSPTKSATTADRQQLQARRASGIIPPSSYAAKPPSLRNYRPASPSKSAPGIAAGRGKPAPLAVSTRRYDGAVTPTTPVPVSAGASTSPSPTSSPFVANATPQPRKVSKPSLADRTKESLAHLPGTPASDRRRSGVYVRGSPPRARTMAPPARPASAMGTLRRPGTSGSMGSTTGQRPPSPLKKPSISTPVARRTSVNYSTPATGRRSISAQLPRPPSAAGTTPRPPTTQTIRSLRPPTTKQYGTVTKRATPKPASSIRSSVYSQATDSTTDLDAQSDDSPLSPTSNTSRAGQDVSKSSSSFRRAVERAKFATRNARLDQAAPIEGDFDMSFDPFNQRPRNDGGHVLRRRITTGLTQGRLNISDMGLDQIPDSVLRMYDAESMEESKLSWSETVDLTVLNAADNKFATLGEDAFPEVDPEEAMHDDSVKASVFAGLDNLDLRGNQLLSLPRGIRFLKRLTTLNLSRNQIGNSAFDVLSQISTLKKLFLAGNHVSGFLPQSVGSLTNLESLDVSDNRILSIPESIRDLSQLRQLNISGNQLTGLPMDALEALPITELDISSNALVGALFPFGVSGLKQVHELNVSNNSLASLAFSESVALPNIRILKVSNNRIVSLPDMSGWSELVTLAAGGNKLGAIPQGFVSLRRIRMADFSSNDITRLDERIALMDSLESLVVSANPLVDRKFLTMSADSIKRDLRNRLEPDVTSQRTSGSFVDEGIDMRSPEDDAASPFKITADGAMDLTAQNLNDEDGDGFRSLLGMHDVKQLQLAQNKMTFIPYELSLAQNLKSLDLSMCELGAQFVQEHLSLPCLQDLQLGGNKISTLDSMIENLNAPYLRHLDLSHNRLSGSLPVLRLTFPHLADLLAADNKIESVSPEALKGLHTVILTRNNIMQLPAEIGLLWFDGLKGLDVMGNSFRVPNQATMQKGTEATLAWLRGRIPGYAGDDETF